MLGADRARRPGDRAAAGLAAVGGAAGAGARERGARVLAAHRRGERGQRELGAADDRGAFSYALAVRRLSAVEEAGKTRHLRSDDRGGVLGLHRLHLTRSAALADGARAASSLRIPAAAAATNAPTPQTHDNAPEVA